MYGISKFWLFTLAAAVIRQPYGPGLSGCHIVAAALYLPRRPMNYLFPKPHFDFVHRGIEVCQLHIVVKQGQLWRTTHQLAEAHPNEPYHHPSVVEPVENPVHRLAQHMVEGGVGDALLHIVRVEVGVADFYRHAARQFALRA